MCFHCLTEDVFTQSLAATVNENTKNDNLVEAGDVFVLNNTSPWRVSDDPIFGIKSLEGEDDELGMQLVVEMSTFNYDRATTIKTRYGRPPGNVP